MTIITRVSTDGVAVAETITQNEAPLSRIIRERGLKKAWVAAKLGMRPNRISDLSAGRSMWTLDEAVRAAELFGVDVKELLP